MPRLRMILVTVALLALVPGVAVAQTVARDLGGTLVAVDRDEAIAADDRVETLVVVSGNAVVDGRAQTVVVVDGALTVSGTVESTLVAVDTDVTLTSTAVVDGDIIIPSGTLTRAEGATVTGSVRREFDLRLGWVLGILPFLFWIGMTVSFLLVGLVLVAIARKQVRGAGDLLTDAPGLSILATVILVIVLPIAAFAAIVTILGLPFGLALLFVLLPVLWTGGYVLASERLGRALLGRGDAEVSAYRSVVLGLLVFQVIALIPVLGGLVVVLAATYGAGGLSLYAWRAWRGGPQPAAGA